MLRPALLARPRPSELPLSYAQRRLWFLDRLEGAGARAAAGRAPGSGLASYTIPLAVRLTGGLDRAALHGALNDLVARHESLRTLFADRLGVPRQEIVPAGAARLELAVAPVAAGALAATLTAAAHRGFDLSRELPLRAQLYQIAAADPESCGRNSASESRPLPDLPLTPPVSQRRASTCC